MEFQYIYPDSTNENQQLLPTTNKQHRKPGPLRKAQQANLSSSKRGPSPSKRGSTDTDNEEKIHCPICDYHGSRKGYKVHLGLRSKGDSEDAKAHAAQLKKLNTCPICQKYFPSKIDVHVRRCCAKRGKDEFVEAVTAMHVTPTIRNSDCDIPSRDSRLSSLEYERERHVKEPLQTTLKNKFRPATHDSPPVVQCVKKESIKLPAASEIKDWAEIQDKLVVALEKLQYLINVESDCQIDVAVEKYENVVYDTLLELCDKHAPVQRDHPQRAAAKRGKAGKRELWLKERKRLLGQKRKAIAKGSIEVSLREKREVSREWRQITKMRRQVRVKREKRNLALKEANEQRKFMADKYRYSKELFDPPNSAAPTFGVDEAYQHFTKTNTDNDRSAVLQPLPGWERPPRPAHVFQLSEPTLEQLKAAVACKKSKCAPGINAIPYVVYKKCPAILKFLLQIFKRVWNKQTIPVSWQRGMIVLIPKSSTTNLADPAEFRPIALLNSEGRLFFTLMEWRLSDYMIKNGYFDTTVQKGFMREVAGCVEHSETIYRAAQDARIHGRDLCVSWIDLANAYGSVKHSLIHFSLEWYHVPDQFRQLMWHYYEGLMASVMVGKLQTDWFWFGIGVFQGCTVSTVLFNAGFNTTFQHLQSLKADCAYQFRYEKKGKPLRLLQTGYADDLALVTGTRMGVDAFANNEKVLQRLQEWSEWSKAGGAKGLVVKPKKCIAAGFRNGEPVDPKLKVWESDGIYYPRCLEPGEAFKFLGKSLLATLSNNWHKEAMEGKFNEYAKLIDGTLLTGIQKAWIWQHFAMAKFSWDFLISDVPPSFVEATLQPIQTRFLKKWVGLAVKADPSILYRSHRNAGLGWKEVRVEHKKNQLIRRHQLQSSRDPQVKEIHERFADGQRAKNKDGKIKKDGRTNEWKVTCELDQLLAEAKVSKMILNPTSGTGLGYKPRTRAAGMSKEKAERAEILRIFGEIEEEKRLVKVMSKPLIGEQTAIVPLDGCPDEKKGNYFCGWLRWENTLAANVQWETLLRKSASYLKFVLNATQDSLPTPSRLRCWDEKRLVCPKCPLGCRESGTLKHILCSCRRAHNPSKDHTGRFHNRIKWRHDSILEVIEQAVLAQIAHEKNEREKQARVEKAAAHVNPLFVQGVIGMKSDKGTKFSAPRSQITDKAVFQQGSDWKVQFDFENQEGVSAPFPPEIAVVSGVGSRPDGVIWSAETKTIVWIELTSPWEENLRKNHDLKKGKYNELVIDLREGKHVGGIKWTVVPLYVEVGCRGAIYEGPWFGMCRRLGFTKTITRRVTQAAQETAVMCSYHLFLCRFIKVWEEKPRLGKSIWMGTL